MGAVILISENSSRIRSLVQKLADREGFELVDAIISPGHKKLTVRVLIHRLGGVTIEDCRRFSESLETLMEVEGIPSGPFVLEVSSPGISRHMKTAADFKRNMGREIEVTYFSREGRTTKACGTILDVQDNEIHLRTDEGLAVIPCEAVQKARPLIDWRKLFKAGEKRLTLEENADE